MPDHRRTMTWTALRFPDPISLDTGRAAAMALAGISGHPRLVLEVTGRGGSVSWKLGCEAGVKGRVLDALCTQVAGLEVTDMASTFDGLRADTATSVRLRGLTSITTSGINTDATEQVIRGMLGALARTKQTELLHVQLILGPRRRPQLDQRQSSSARRRQNDRALQHQFLCEVRIGASSNDPARSRSLIQAVVGALRSLEAPGVHVSTVGTSTRAFSQARSPLFWRNRLSTSEITPLTGWPITSARLARLPGVPSPHPRLLQPTSAVSTRGRLLGTSASGPARQIALSIPDSLRHLHVVGPTGVGKSTLLARLALQDITEGRAVVVIDPKGDLVDDILARADERRRDDIVVIDAADSAPVGINPLAGAGDPELVADILLGLFHSIYADAWGPRTQDVLHAGLLTLARRGDTSIAMLPLLITNPGFRRSIVGQVAKTDPLGLGSFWAWWDGISEAERQQATAPLMRRLRPLLMRPGLRAILAQRTPKFAMADVFTKRRVVLVKLSKGTIGPEAAALLGSLVVSQLWTTALGRISTDAKRRHPVMLYIDEVQDYLRLPGDLGEVLTQARGLGLGLTLAHQHLDQLPRALHAAIMANARSRIAFQLTGKDARELAGLTRGQLEPDDFDTLPAFNAYAQLLSGNQTAGWVSLTTTPLPPPIRPAKNLQMHAAARYGQPISEVEADLLSLLDPPAHADHEPIGRARRQPGTNNNPQKGGSS